MPLKHFIVFTFSGEGCSMALKAQREGLEAAIAIIKDPTMTMTDEERKKGKNKSDPEEQARRMNLYTNVVPTYDADKVIKKLKDVPQDERADYFLFFDMNYTFRYAEQVAGMGFHGNFPTQKDRAFEADREAGKKFVEANYPLVRVAEYHEFKSADDAKAFLDEEENMSSCWVMKAYEDAPTIVPMTNDPEKAKTQILDALEIDKDKYEKGGFLLEKMIPNVLEFTPEMMFYNGTPICVTLDVELKKKAAGEKGRTCGCAANAIITLRMDDPIVEAAFPPAVLALAKQHEGLFIWDASLLIDPETGTKYFGEFCSNRPGWDAFMTEVDMAGGVVNFFNAVCEGKDPFAGKELFGFAVRSFNEHDDSEEAGMPKKDVLITADEYKRDHLWFYDCYYGSNGDWLTCGYIPDLCVATGVGTTFQEAVDRAYEAMDSVTFEDILYRPKHDIMSRAYPASLPGRYEYGLSTKLYHPKINEEIISRPEVLDTKVEQEENDIKIHITLSWKD